MRTEPEIAALVREERAAAASAEVGPCEVCGATVNVTALDGRARCYEHRGGSPARRELDHVGGIENLPQLTISLPANAHRRVTDLRLASGTGRWPTAHGDPLLQAAHAVAGFASLLQLVAEWLVVLSRHVASKFGAAWWTGATSFPLA